MKTSSEFREYLRTRWQLDCCRFFASDSSGLSADERRCCHMVLEGERCWYHTSEADRDPRGWPVYVVFSATGERHHPLTFRDYIGGAARGALMFPPPSKAEFEAGQHTPFRSQRAKPPALLQTENEFQKLVNSGEGALAAVLEQHECSGVVEYLQKVWVPELRAWETGGIATPFD